MNAWCHICVRNGPCVHTENQARWQANSDRQRLEREAAERAKQDTRNLTPAEAWQAKSAAEKKSPPPDSEDYWNQVHQDANRDRRAAGWPDEPRQPRWKTPDEPCPDPELSSDAGWRRPIQSSTRPPSRKTRPRREPVHRNRWEIPSTFKVGGSRIRVPAPESAEIIRHSAAIFCPELQEQPDAFMIHERHCQDSLTTQADSIVNQIVGAHWPTLEFSDLKPIAVPFGRRGGKHLL